MGGRAGAGGAGGASGIGGAAAGASGAAGQAARCAGVPATCGPNANADCCASSVIPGGAFNRSNDSAYPATVSSFRLDTYELTVGRFRKFLAAYPSNKPAAGSGKNPNDAADTGWEAAWPLPADSVALLRAIKCDRMYQTWTDEPATHETFPMNCIDWYVSFAFCIWDGGRLPTEAEWNFAAAGGAEQRAFPWSNPPSEMTSDTGYVVTVTPAAVGSKSPRGDGRWGQTDLSGNLGEWTRDWLDTYPLPCSDCANRTETTWRTLRGGGYNHPPSAMTSRFRSNLSPQYPEGDVGVRCARSP
jgi:formylglycine-generating enzyme required for sulfatase activity